MALVGVAVRLLSVGAFVHQAAAAVNALNSEQQERQQSLETAWDAELEDGAKHVSPIRRVVNLLSKMKAELGAETTKESEMYDKMVCWCESNEKEKTQDVAEAESRDSQLSTEVQVRSARSGQLSAKIGVTKKEIAANAEALNRATAIREEEASKFRAEESDMVQAVTNLRNAVVVLSKHQKTQSLLQLEGPVLAGMRVLLREVALKYEEMMAGRSERARFEVASHHHVAFLSLKAEARRAEAATEGISKALFSALDVQDHRFSGALGAKFAARVVAEAAGGSAAGDEERFLQVGQPLYESRSSARSGEIFGVLKQMQAEFEAELSSMQKEEASGQAAFKELAAAKTAEIEAGKKSLDDMEVEAAGNQKALADAKEDLTLTREQRSADVKFLQNLKLTCNDLDAQWTKRSQTRAAETQAVSEAIAILTEDDNRETTARAVTFMEINQHSGASLDSAARRSSAAAVLRRAADAPDFDTDDLLSAWHGRSVGAAAGPRAQLSTLAMAVQLDAFSKVKEMMDKMLANLKEEQAEEVRVKAHCTEELNSNTKAVYEKSENKKDLESSIDRLATLIQQLEGDIAGAKKQIAETGVEIQSAGATREVENAEFQRVVADQRATQAILKKALSKLKDFYEKGIGKAALAQRDDQEPPVKFNAYKANAGSSPVIGLIEQIVEDSQRLEKEASSSEYQAQATYETFVKDANAVIKGLQKATVAKTDTIAASKREAAEAGSDLESTEDELESLAAYEADLHNQCDFLLKNFDVRQKARLQEMEAIQAAKAVLSGMK